MEIHPITWVIPVAGIAAIAFALYLAWDVLRSDIGTEAMQEIAGTIFEGAVAFIRRQYRTIGLLALGSLLGFGAYAIVDRSMTILSAAVGAMMVGMGVDYSIHYLTHYETLRSAGRDGVFQEEGKYIAGDTDDPDCDIVYANGGFITYPVAIKGK